MADFRFTNEHSAQDVANIVDVLRGPRLWIPTDQDYPNHSVWLDKTEAQIVDGTKRAMAAYSGKLAVGSVIYQRHPEIPTVLELRNISLAPDMRGRHFGHFLLHTAEGEAARNDFPGIEEIVVDTKVTNEGMISFLLAQGYDIKEITDLYGLGAGLDVVFSKTLK